MPLALLIALPLLMQAGPLVGDGPAPSLNLPQIDRPTAADRRRHEGLGSPVPTRIAAPSRLEACLSEAGDDPDSAIDSATAWLKQAQGSATAEPQLCLGTAYAARGEWDEAEHAFLAGRDAAAASDRGLRARLGAMAGNAALANGAPERALTTLDAAIPEAQASGQPPLAGDIEIDRARALVALKHEEAAVAALARARLASPNNPEAWLLSATLSRRMNKLVDAQAQIETAAQLAPTDPEIGLEAGVIAMLAGHEPAARKSWQSVIAAAPGSEPARKAGAYLVQLQPVSSVPAPAAPTAPAESR